MIDVCMLRFPLHSTHEKALPILYFEYLTTMSKTDNGLLLKSRGPTLNLQFGPFSGLAVSGNNADPDLIAQEINI